MKTILIETLGCRFDCAYFFRPKCLEPRVPPPTLCAGNVHMKLFDNLSNLFPSGLVKWLLIPSSGFTSLHQEVSVSEPISYTGHWCIVEESISHLRPNTQFVLT